MTIIIILFVSLLMFWWINKIVTFNEYSHIIANPGKYDFSKVQITIKFIGLVSLGISNRYNKHKQKLYLILGEKGNKKYIEISQAEEKNEQKNESFLNWGSFFKKHQEYNPIGIYQRVVLLDKGGDKFLTQEAKKRIDEIYSNKSSDGEDIFKNVDFKTLNRDIFGEGYDHYTGKFKK